MISPSRSLAPTVRPWTCSRSPTVARIPIASSFLDVYPHDNPAFRTGEAMSSGNVNRRIALPDTGVPALHDPVGCAQVDGAHEAVGHHVLDGVTDHRLRSQHDGGHVAPGLRVGDPARERPALSPPQRHREVGDGRRLLPGRLVHGHALLAGEYLTEPVDRRVLAGDDDRAGQPAYP